VFDIPAGPGRQPAAGPGSPAGAAGVHQGAQRLHGQGGEAPAQGGRAGAGGGAAEGGPAGQGGGGGTAAPRLAATPRFAPRCASPPPAAALRIWPAARSSAYAALHLRMLLATLLVDTIFQPSCGPRAVVHPPPRPHRTGSRGRARPVRRRRQCGRSFAADLDRAGEAATEQLRHLQRQASPRSRPRSARAKVHIGLHFDQ
jgi:hypothetical protein